MSLQPFTTSAQTVPSVNYSWRNVQKLEEAIAPEQNFDIANAQNTFRLAMVDATVALWLPALVRSIEREAPKLTTRMVPLTTTGCART